MSGGPSTETVRAMVTNLLALVRKNFNTVYEQTFTIIGVCTVNYKGRLVKRKDWSLLRLRLFLWGRVHYRTD